MSASVDVGGVRVNQDVLATMFSALSERHTLGIPADYTPSIERFGPTGGITSTTSATYEQIVYEYIRDGAMPEWFREKFLDCGKRTPTPRKRPVAVLRAAGYPPISWAINDPSKQPTHNTVASWAEELDIMAASWLWVRCPDEGRRVTALAHAAIAAAAHDVEDITYRECGDLCEEVNSADLYGEASKYNALLPYRRCGVLVLDNLGGERRGARELQTLSTLIEARYRQMMPTVIGSSYGLTALGEAYGSIDHDKGAALCARVATAMCGYRIIGNDSERRAALMRHVVDL